MESASNRPSAEEIADLVVKRLVEGGGIAIRIGNERLDEQQQAIDRYAAAGIPDQQHGQSHDAPANGWSGRAAVIQGDGGRAQIRDSLWGEDKPSDKKHRWWRETPAGVLQTVHRVIQINLIARRREITRHHQGNHFRQNQRAKAASLLARITSVGVAVIRLCKRSLRPGRATIILGWPLRPRRISVASTKPKSKRSWATV